MEKEFTITKPNGTLLTRKVDSSNNMMISKLTEMGWKEKGVKPKKVKKGKKK